MDRLNGNGHKPCMFLFSKAGKFKIFSLNECHNYNKLLVFKQTLHTIL